MIYNHPDIDVEKYYEELLELSRLAFEGEIAQSVYEEKLYGIATGALLMAFTAGGGNLEGFYSPEMQALIAQVNNSIRLVSEDIYGKRYTSFESLERRFIMWTYTLGRAISISYLFLLGEIHNGVITERKLRWRRGSTKEPCETCLDLDGKILSASQWKATGFLPQSSSLDCGGFYCQCYFELV